MYVTSFGKAGRKWKVSNGNLVRTNLSSPLELSALINWAADEKSLFYTENDKVLKVEVRENREGLEFSQPRELMSVPPEISLIALMADGRRTLALRGVGPNVKSPLNLALNWKHLLPQE